jgi:cation diffusion facilitator family transporter
MKKAIRIQQFIAGLSIALFLSKLVAWYLTQSVMVLTDALEGIVNVVAGFLGLFSISVASRPKDHTHPYGHGKAEFLSAAVEGTLILIAGGIIIFEGIERLITPHELEKLDVGLIIVACAGTINFITGKLVAIQGAKMKSMVLTSAGHHLVTDAYSGIAIISGLIFLLFTNNKYLWVDSAIALVFGVLILRTGYKVIRKSIAGIMDETDMPLLLKVIGELQANRKREWVDIHHLRVAHHGGHLHVDAHLTVPRYFTIAEADEHVKALGSLVKEHNGRDTEVFVQTEACTDDQCICCGMAHCKVRTKEYVAAKEWTLQNMWKEVRHQPV